MKGLDIMLSIRSTQTDPDGNVTRSENTQPAVLYETPEGYRIEYTLLDEDGDQRLQQMELSESRALIRSFPFTENTSICLVPGQEKRCAYETSFGTLFPVTRTASIRIRSINKNIHAKLEYELCMDDYVTSFIILIKAERQV